MLLRSLQNDEVVVAKQQWLAGMPPAHLQRVQREVDALASLASHPNIIEYVEYFEVNHPVVRRGARPQSYLYIAMAYADGGDVNHTAWDEFDVTGLAQRQQGPLVLGLQCYHSSGDSSAGVVLALAERLGRTDVADGLQLAVSLAPSEEAVERMLASAALHALAVYVYRYIMLL